MYNKISLNNSYFNKKVIDGVTLKLNKSTSQAEAFHFGLKVACLDWQDPIIPFLQSELDKRLLEIAEANEKGINYKVTLIKNEKSTFMVRYECLDEVRAMELAFMQYPQYKIKGVEKVENKVEIRRYDEESEAIICNPF